MNLLEEYNKREDIIKKRLEDFSKVPKEDYFYEACFCILTPQSSAKSCWKAILLLKENDFDIYILFENPENAFSIKKIILKCRGFCTSTLSSKSYSTHLKLLTEFGSYKSPLICTAKRLYSSSSASSSPGILLRPGIRSITPFLCGAVGKNPSPGI